MASSAAHLYDTPSAGLGRYRVLESVERHHSPDALENTKQRVHHALKHFPELNGVTVTVASQAEEKRGYAQADPLNDIIFLPIHEECPYITVCHELAHLAIEKLDRDGVDVPTTSEEFCSIFAVARMPPSRIDRADIAYLGEPEIRRERWPKVCRHALDYREDHHDYIQQCKRWLGVTDNGGDGS